MADPALDRVWRLVVWLTGSYPDPTMVHLVRRRLLCRRRPPRHLATNARRRSRRKLRVHETRHGLKMPRYDWTDAELAARLEVCLGDPKLKARLASTSAHMQSQSGSAKAATLLDALLAGARA